MAIQSLLLMLALLAAAAATTPRTTPMLGFNTWNHYGCAGISARVLMDTADHFVALGLNRLGYTFINSDDCWMQQERADNGRGPMQPDQGKFKHGIEPVAEYIHAKGLSMGLYTTRANRSCGGYAGSCQHEQVDMQQWARWKIDYVKDDSCGSCNRPVERDYTIMQAAINQSGRSMCLTIEGGANITQASSGTMGQARRVGHDISDDWISMISLIDQAANLWPYVHNGSRSLVHPAQGFWNDLDMLELGNGGFKAESSPLHAAQARTHYSMWCILKALLLLGADLTTIGPQTLSIIKNSEAIAINQDPYGNQAQRISVQQARNGSLSAPSHALVLLALCSGQPSQRWYYQVPPGNTTSLLYTVDRAGQAWCMTIPGGGQSRWTAVPCNQASQHNGMEAWAFAPADNGTFHVLGGWTRGKSTLQMGYAASPPGQQGVAPGYGASGPVPHTRWVAATVNSDMNAYNDPVDGHYIVPPTSWRFDLAAARGGNGSLLQSTDQFIMDDDNVGGAKQGGDFCLELNSGSALEVWASVIQPTAAAQQRWAVALLNRSPSSDSITLDFALLPGNERDPLNSNYVVRDIWANVTHPAVDGKSYVTVVSAHDTALLVVTEVSEH